MKKILFLIAALSLTLTGSAQVLASSTPNLQVQIFPLECSLDSTALGNINTLQFTPENCMPGQQELPTILSFPMASPEGESAYFPGSNTTFLNDPILHIPSSDFPASDIKGPLIVDAEEKTKEKTPSQEQANIAVGTTVLVSAGILAAVHAVYTGVVAPAIAQGNIPKIRFPWSKK